MISSGSNKRARLLSISTQLNIDNLPDSVLLHITGYLQETSRVLLAVALTASSAKPPEASNVIISADRWDIRNKNFRTTVDFVDTDKALAARLSDEDIAGVLKVVGAVHTIEKVKLTHCVGISGCGLEPLRGCSTTLKQLDLSLVADNKSPKLSPEPMISEDEVLPILDSIIDADNCALKHVQFPKKWRDEQSQPLIKFLSKYNRAMNDRNITCSYSSSSYECEEVCEGNEELPWVNTTGNDFGINNYTCYTCLSSHCSDCAEDEIPDILCEKCEKKYCSGCDTTMECDTCQEITCHECSFIGECETCMKSTCGDCCAVFYCGCCRKIRCMDCKKYNFCDNPKCHQDNCVDCDSEGPDSVVNCLECGGTYCGEHLLKDHLKYGGDWYCPRCSNRAIAYLSYCNESFEKWVKELEERYGIKHVSQSHAHVVEDLSDAVNERKRLRQRCKAVGNILSFKQKNFERFDNVYRMYQSLDSSSIKFLNNKRVEQG